MFKKQIKSHFFKKINIRATDYRFEDKKKYYERYTTKQKKEGTKIIELLNLAREKNDFIKKDLLARDNAIIDSFISFVDQNNLIK